MEENKVQIQPCRGGFMGKVSGYCGSGKFPEWERIDYLCGIIQSIINSTKWIQVLSKQ